MPTGDEDAKVSRQHIQLVQNLIERCLQLYMSHTEVVNTLLQQAKIEPGFTELVWQRLEQENQEFFKAYRLRLIVKEQILKFNRLLERQVELMHELGATGVSIPITKDSHILPMHQNSVGYAPEPMGSNIHQSLGTRLHNSFINGGLSVHPAMQATVDMSAHARSLDTSPNMMLAQSLNVPAMNGGTIKSEADYAAVKSEVVYADNSSLMYGTNGTHPVMGDPSVSSFSSMESNPQPLHETVLDADISSFGYLGQIPRNFSLSDLTALTNSSDILESYSRSPFLGTDSANFLDPYGRREYQGDVNKLDTISEGLSYEDFGSD